MGEPWEFVLHIDNQGRYEPHVELIWIEMVNGPSDDWHCEVMEPNIQDVKRRARYSLFVLQPYRIRRGQTAIIRVQCTFQQPGAYEMLWNFAFEESGIAFFSEKILIEVR